MPASISNRQMNPALSTVLAHLAGEIGRGAASARPLREGEIHDFRLAVKYLRTILEIAGSVAGRLPGSKELRAMLDPPFDAAGGIRTAQVNLEILRRGGAVGSAAVGEALAADERRSRAELSSLTAGFDLERFGRLAEEIRSAAGGLENARVTVRAEEFLLARYSAIARTAKRAKTPRDLHEIRKNVKAARNALRLIAACGISRRSGIEARILGALDRSLGRWHDGSVFRKRMREFDRAAVPGASAAADRPWSPAEEDSPARVASLARDAGKRLGVARRVPRIS